MLQPSKTALSVTSALNCGAVATLRPDFGAPQSLREV
jgi:hypothetical protein